MSKLRLGKMSGQEIAEWLGIKYNPTYRNNPTRQLKKLDDYCKYTRIRGGIIVEKIYVDEYNKDLKKNIDLIYFRSVVDHNYLVSVSGMAEENDVSKYLLTKSRNKLFGETLDGIKSSAPGILGVREMVWCIKLKGCNNYRYMTEDEQELFDSIIKSVYGNLDVEKIKARELIKEYCLKNDLKVREMEKLLDQKGCNFFFEVIEKFKKQTGLVVVHATRHELGLNMENSQQEEEYAKMLRKEVLEEDLKCDSTENS